jgi:AraC-like DNA-binding protein
MHVETFYPQHPLLKKHIAYYYFVSTNTSNYKCSYFFFPHVYHSLNIHKNASCEIGTNAIRVYGVKEPTTLLILQGMPQAPVMATLEGILNKVTIIFQPMSLPSFIQTALAESGTLHSQVFNCWDCAPQFDSFLNDFFTSTDNKERVNQLENFLLSVYRPPVFSSFLKNAGEILMDFSKEREIEEIAKQLSIPLRTFNRQFKKYMCISPSAFRKTARFRHSMKNGLFRTRFTKLTEVAYESNFYDQPYFNKIYKQFTGDNPGKFFKAVDALADKQLILKFITESAVG